MCRVSVIIPCYCCADTIERAVRSVVAQTHRPVELILVDDASGDGTGGILRDLQVRLGVDWIRIISLSENVGPSLARNAGWEAATQPYIAFLDADDAWHPRKIEVQYTWMRSHPKVALTGHECVRVSSELSDITLAEYWRARPVNRCRLLLSNCFSTPCVMLRSDLPYRFEPAKRHSEDYLLWLQIVLGGHIAWRLELPLAYLYKAPFGEGGVSADLWEMENGELDTYGRLRTAGLISVWAWLALMPYSVVKFIRRLLMTNKRLSTLP